MAQESLSYLHLPLLFSKEVSQSLETNSNTSIWSDSSPTPNTRKSFLSLLSFFLVLSLVWWGHLQTLSYVYTNISLTATKWSHVMSDELRLSLLRKDTAHILGVSPQQGRGRALPQVQAVRVCIVCTEFKSLTQTAERLFFIISRCWQYWVMLVIKYWPQHPPFCWGCCWSLVKYVSN